MNASQERVLLPRTRLHVLPARAQHVLASVNQLLRVPHRVLVQAVGSHTRILAEAIAGAAMRASPFRAPLKPDPRRNEGWKTTTTATVKRVLQKGRIARSSMGTK